MKIVHTENRLTETSAPRVTVKASEGELASMCTEEGRKGLVRVGVEVGREVGMPIELGCDAVDVMWCVKRAATKKKDAMV